MSKNSETNPNSRRQTTLVVLAIGLAAALTWALWNRSGTPKSALHERQLAMRQLAESIASAHPTARVLVIGNPFTQRPGQSDPIQLFETAAIAGLRSGLGANRPAVIAYPALRPEFDRDPASVYIDPKTTTPLSYLVAGSAFDELANKNTNCNLIVSLIGLPTGIRSSQVWNKTPEPRFALLLPDWRTLGDQATVSQAFRSGKIAAAVLRRPGAPGEDQPLRSDAESEFARRFLLVTPGNIEEMLRTFPQLF